MRQLNRRLKRADAVMGNGPGMPAHMLEVLSIHEEMHRRLAGADSHVSRTLADLFETIGNRYLDMSEQIIRDLEAAQGATAPDDGRRSAKGRQTKTPGSSNSARPSNPARPFKPGAAPGRGAGNGAQPHYRKAIHRLNSSS